jgi:hypothetical protein
MELRKDYLNPKKRRSERIKGLVSLLRKLPCKTVEQTLYSAAAETTTYKASQILSEQLKENSEIYRQCTDVHTYLNMEGNRW